MTWNQLRKFKALLYKNFLVRKRHWKLGLFVEILIPLLMFLALWHMKSVTLNDKFLSDVILTTVENDDTHFQPVSDTFYFGFVEKDYLLIVPDNKFTRELRNYLGKCYPGPITIYPTEADMTNDYLANRHSKFSKDTRTLALIFDDKNVNISTKNFKYKIQISEDIPSIIYSVNEGTDVFKTSFTGLQLCVDSTLIKMKKSDKFYLNILTRRMPIPAWTDTKEIVKLITTTICGLAVSTFLIPLCIETFHASTEKYLGVNVLMSMNGVPNYLNMLSWLVTGLIFSNLYIVPIVLFFSYADTEYSTQFFEYGNGFIVFLVLILNVGHLITFGIHTSAYFTSSLFMVTGLIVIYVGSMVFMSKGINVDSYEIIPFLGIIFPNMLLFRAFEEINFYEDIKKGIHFNNLFQVTHRAYGVGGSVGFMLIFSIIGMIFHLLLANYIYAVNPGKYGVRKSPFYFLKKMKKTGDYDVAENFEFDDMPGKSFEPVTESTYSPGIQIRNLKKLYKTSLFSKTGVHALQGVSVDFYKGYITALLGHNGAGKTTMMSILSGMVSSSEGLVIIDGMNVEEQIDEIMNDMGFCPQENILFPQLSVAEQVKFFAMLRNTSKSLSVINSEVTQLLSQLQLHGKRNALPHQLSEGQKRRACLAMALIGESGTLVLDEPTSGLDPESKRDIWNVLLKLRGHKTILISTHDMEEADVLGDRIAIMHSGQLKSYGTPLYLKKLLGRGNIEVTLSTEPWCDPENVRLNLTTQSEVISDDHGKMVLSVPYNDALPDILDQLEEKKKKLGITGISVSIMTLQKVFLKVTQDNNDPSESRHSFTNTTRKLEGVQQILHTWKALLCKKATYTLKNLFATIVIFLLFMATSWCTISISKSEKSSEEEVSIKLDMYQDTENYYKIRSYGKPYADNYARLIRDLGGQSREASIDLDDELLKIASKDYKNYCLHILMAASFESIENHSVVSGIAYYNSALARFAQPISINLVANAILRNVTDENHSIEITAQAFPKDNDYSDTNSAQILRDAIGHGYVVAVLLASLIYPAVALFVVHPIRESLTNVKLLQRMTGASCFSYWGTMFIFDFTVFFIITLLFIFGLVVGDYMVDLRMFAWREVLIQLGLFALLAVNTLLLAYVFSFWKRSTTAVLKLLSLLPLALVMVDLVMICLTAIYEKLPRFDRSNEELGITFYRRIQKIIFLFTPYVSFFEGQVVFFNATWINALCSKIADYIDFNTTCKTSGKRYNLIICCDMRCDEDACGQAVPYFLGFDEDLSLNVSFLALCITPILYLGILLILEYQLFDRLFVKIRGGMPDNTDDDFEEQVKKVKHEIAYEVYKAKLEGTSNRTAAENFEPIPKNGHDQIVPNERESKDYVFFVYELRKIYGNCRSRIVAVQDISFGVNEGECFGLLGVNGAGKSTTFKMMTGEEVPNHGIIHLRDKHLQGDKNYLEQVGYCPQKDAIIESLNAYDHLHLFGRLRGIPDDQLEQEVKNWIDRLNLSSCALQPSGTYSGGNKRRLNIAMALIGNPNLILMDEPTTGVDPAARRSLWNTIQSCQATGQAVILTSHSMEECEALCNKLAIMVNGKFVCIGPSEELKQRFGAGYDIQIKLSPIKPEGEVDKIKQTISKALPGEIVDETSGSLLYHVSSTNVTWRRMYNVMKELKKKYTSIEDFSVLSSTLEQLFLLFAKAASRAGRP